MVDDCRYNQLDNAVLAGRQPASINVHHRFDGSTSAVLIGGADAGLFLRYVRERKGLTRQFVADMACLSYDTVKRLERGRPCTTVQTVIDVCSRLGCELEIREKAPA